MADVLEIRNDYRLENWVEIIRERQTSGLTNREFCAQRGISEKTYYYWLRKLRQTAAASMTPPQIVKLPEDVDLKAVVGLLNALRSHD